MKLGVLLPLFRTTLDDALTTVDEAARLGLDGVFAYDHLYPIGHPERPAFRPFPALAAAAMRSDLVLAPLVARVGLVDDALLVQEFATLAALAPGRVLGALGVGDHLSADEHARYGIDLRPLDERRARLDAVAAELSNLGLPIWVGGSGPTTVARTRAIGAAVNCWAASARTVADLAAGGEVTWAGDLPRDLDEAASVLGALASAGATWAVATYAAPASFVAEAAAKAGLVRSG